jgi:hypothetical protein
MSVGTDPFASLSDLSLAPGPAVQTPVLDLARHSRRQNVIERLAAGDELPDLARCNGMLLDLEDLHVARGGNRLARAGRNGDRNQAQDRVWLLPGVEDSPLVGADHKYGVLELLVAQQVDREGMVVQPHVGVGQGRKGQARELEPCRGIEHRRLVARVCGHEDKKPIGTELAKRALGQRDVTEMRRVEGAAEDRSPQSVTVSSPISTSAPALAPTARNASSRASRSGGVPTILKPRSVRRIRKGRSSGRGR